MFQVWSSGEPLCHVARAEIRHIIRYFICFVDMPSRTVILW
jgi:hypothetical protein